MSKSNTFENELLLLLFNNTTIVDLVGDLSSGTTGDLRGSASAGNFHVSLHTSDPGEAGSQNTNEIAYTSYARVAVARSSSGWTVSGNTVNPTSAITFPTGTGGSGTATHWGVGTASSGAGILLFKGTITPNIVCGSGITPILGTATSIVED